MDMKRLPYLHLNLNHFNWEGISGHFSLCNIRKNGSGFKSINHHNYEILKALAFSTPLWSKLAKQKHSTWKFWKKIGSPFSGCMIHHNSISGGSCFFLSAGFARKWVEKIFCKKLHQFPETPNRCHGKLWQEGMFLFLLFYFGNQLVPILAITRLFHRHVPKQPSVRKQKNRFMYVPETYDSPVPFDSAPSQDVSMWNRLFFLLCNNKPFKETAAWELLRSG